MPEKCVSAKKTGKAPTTRITSAHGEKCTNNTAKLTSEIRFCTNPRPLVTRLSGRVDAPLAHAHQLVVELGVFKLREREGLGLLQNHQVDLHPNCTRSNDCCIDNAR